MLIGLRIQVVMTAIPVKLPNASEQVSVEWDIWELRPPANQDCATVGGREW